jgi:membrane protein YqaA with SNARE-associated domain
MNWLRSLAGPLAIDESTWWMAVVSALVIGFILGAVPAGASEAVALGAGTLPSIHLRMSVIVALTAGHITGKVLWYWLGRLGWRVTHPRLHQWVERARTLAMRHPKVGITVTATSAVASVPPFHLMAVAAGLVRTSPVPFFIVAFLGRLVRFGALAAFPSLVRYLFQ